jgi:hypothetical protein
VLIVSCLPYAPLKINVKTIIRLNKTTQEVFGRTSPEGLLRRSPSPFWRMWLLQKQAQLLYFYLKLGTCPCIATKRKKIMPVL